MVEKRLRIGIVGAGIGGLTAGALLARAGHSVSIFDQFANPRALGSGLVIQPVGQAVLALLGLDAKAQARGAAITRMLGHEVDHGRRVLDVSYGAGQGAQGLAIHRAALFDLLLSAAKAEDVQLTQSAQVVSAPLQGAGRTIMTGDGQSFGPFDLVVDASGASSRLSPIRARPLPYGAIWGTVDWPEATGLPEDQLRQKYQRAERMIGVLPLGRPDAHGPRKAALFWSLPVRAMADWAAAPLDQWKADALRLWPEAAPFLAGIHSHADMTPARYSHGTLARPYAPHMVFIGDAAHRASPQLGQGANMALLDALALMRALETGEGEAALRHYAFMRHWHVRIYQAMSWAFTPQYQSDSRWLPLLRDRALFPASMAPPIPRLLTRLVSGTMIPPLAGQAFP